MTNAVLKYKTSTELVKDIVSTIMPHDRLEKEHIDDTIAWITTGVPIFRMAKPDVPNKHLVSYFVLFDEGAEQILLGNHKKAQLWLPPGGHVELDEDPKDTVRRECFEELNIQADFWTDIPIFLTSTVTIGMTAGHTDVSLWYVLKGDHRNSYKFDESEFFSIKWFDFNEIPYQKSDPHMGRFVNKLQGIL